MSTRFVSLLICAALAGCAGETHYRGTVAVSASTPDMVYVAPGVSVIADYDEPIFYSNGYYWYNHEGVWFRSSYYTGGWTAEYNPPSALIRIERPYAYVHYRPHNYVSHRLPVPAYRIQRPIVRDHPAAARRGYYYRHR